MMIDWKVDDEGKHEYIFSRNIAIAVSICAILIILFSNFSLAENNVQVKDNGVLVSANFYQDGANYYFCIPDKAKYVVISVEGTQCKYTYFENRISSRLLSPEDWETKSNKGYTAQQALDKKFGSSVVLFSGLTFHTSGYDRNRINKTAVILFRKTHILVSNPAMSSSEWETSPMNAKNKAVADFAVNSASRILSLAKSVHRTSGDTLVKVSIRGKECDVFIDESSLNKLLVTKLVCGSETHSLTH
jgi:hypothetical protein